MNYAGALAMAGVLLTLVIGWLLNIVQIFRMADDPVTGMFIIKCIGVFAIPLGSILGWLG